MSDTKSTTEQICEHRYVLGLDLGPVYKTTISDGQQTEQGYGCTTEQAEKAASGKWHDRG